MKLKLVILFITLFAISCEVNPETDSDTDPPIVVNPTKADSLAQLGWADMKDIITDNPLGAGENAFESAEQYFNDALAFDPNNSTANFGLAMIKMLDVQYNQELNDYIDSLDFLLESEDTEPPSKISTHNLLTKPFTFLLKSPELVYNQTQRLYKAPGITINEIQELIDGTLIPILNSAITFLAVVETNQSFSLNVSNGQDSLYLDLGEVYMLDAAIHSLLAGLEMITLLDVDILDASSSYNWVDLIDNYEEDGIDYTVEDGIGYRNVHVQNHYNRENSVQDSMLIAQVAYNVFNRPGFLGIRPSKSNGTAVISAIQGITSRLGSANDFIHNSRTNHGNNLISLTNLTEIDSEIDGSSDPDNPNFIQTWTSLADVIDFFNDMVTGPVTFNETIDNKTVNITINLNSFFNGFNGPISLLPKFNFNTGNWIEEEMYYSNYYLQNGDYNIYGNDGFIETISAVDTVFFSNFDSSIDPIILVDDADQAIDEDLFPYFNDYTFGGLFPNMTSRQQWVDLLE